MTHALLMDSVWPVDLSQGDAMLCVLVVGLQARYQGGDGGAGPVEGLEMAFSSMAVTSHDNSPGDPPTIHDQPPVHEPGRTAAPVSSAPSEEVNTQGGPGGGGEEPDVM